MPTGPLVRLEVEILNVGAQDQAAVLAQLANQERLYLAFYGDDLEYRFTKIVPHDKQQWQYVDEQREYDSCSSFCYRTPYVPRRRHHVRALAHLSPTVHARREYSSHDLGADIVQRFSEDTHCMSWGGGGCVLKRDGQDDALAGKDGLAVSAVPPIQEPLDPKETICSS